MTAPRLAWQSALAAYTAAADALETYDRDVMTPVNDAYRTLVDALGPVYEPDAIRCVREEIGISSAQARFDELVTDKCERLDDLLLAPAPDLAAVTWKLDALDEGGDDDTDKVTRAIAADVRRLSADLSTIAESVGLLAASCPAPAWAGAIGRQAERMEGLAQ